jgi:hypothetical protein
MPVTPPRNALALLAFASLLGGACASVDGGPERVPEGRWGGEHVSLDVTQAGATVELDCAHGALAAPLELDEHGRFEVAGDYVQEHGGPSREDGQEDRREAVYFGTSDGRTLQLSIRFPDDSGSLGPFSATLGEAPRLVKCLSRFDPVPQP